MGTGIALVIEYKRKNDRIAGWGIGGAIATNLGCLDPGFIGRNGKMIHGKNDKMIHRITSA
jgi:hypothetical protein